MAGCSLEVPEFLGSTPKAALFCEGSEFKDSAQAEHRPRGSWAWCLLVALACSQRGLRIEPKAHRACGTGHTARPAWSCLLPCAVWTGHHLKHRARRTRHRAALGIEPRTSRTLSENHTPRPTSQLFSLLRHSLWIREITPRDVFFSLSLINSLAPWLSWLKRLSSKF